MRINDFFWDTFVENWLGIVLFIVGVVYCGTWMYICDEYTSRRPIQNAVQVKGNPKPWPPHQRRIRMR
jgi:hypothetical protein